MSLSNLETFKRAVNHVINNWPSLDIAIENGMGGQEARAKRQWMCEVVANAIWNDKHVDLEAYIEDILNHEFDTIMEDESIPVKVHWITKYYNDCIEGKLEQVLDSLANTKVQARPVAICESKDSSSEDEGDDDGDE